MSMRKERILFNLAITVILIWSLLISSAWAGPRLEKPKIAVLKAKISSKVPKNTIKFLDLDKLQAEMERSILALRKFDLVTRNKKALEAILDEQQFAKSVYSAGNAARSGYLKAVDYLVISEVHTFSFYSSTHKIPHLQSKYLKTDQGFLGINIKILDTKTGEIKATFPLKSSFEKNNIVHSKGGAPSRIYFAQMARAVSAQMADKLLDLIFPVKVIKIKNKTLYLNRGQDGGFKRGMVVNVYEPGEPLIDPDTNEIIGSAEEFVGKIKIVKVNPKFTIARILHTTSGGKIKVGCIVRKP